MGGLRGQQRRLLRQACLPWDERVKEPRWRLLGRQRPDGLRETLRAQAREVLKDPSTPRLPFPWA